MVFFSVSIWSSCLEGIRKIGISPIRLAGTKFSVGPVQNIQNIRAGSKYSPFHKTLPRSSSQIHMDLGKVL